MFSERELSPELSTVRENRAPDALVLDAAEDFEVLDAPRIEALLPYVGDVRPAEYDADWLPAESPHLLARLTGDDLVVGAPEDGSVTWTARTEPPVVVVKPRVEGVPDAFVDFLIGEALVEVGLGLPEQFLGFFRDRYPVFADALDADPATTYQVAAAVTDAYRGVHTRGEFRDWADEVPDLHAAWRDAGERLEPRLDGLTEAVARGDTDFADAAELACNAVKHHVDVPAPFGALDDPAYREYGADYAVEWAKKL